MNDVINTFLLVYAGLFPFVNPVGVGPIFLGLTRHCTQQERNVLALRVTRNSLLLLIGSLLAGSYVLEFFGITLPVVRVAGGLLVTATGWNLLQSGDNEDVPSERAPVRPTDAFYPLTMPITVGPGSIAVAITLGSQRPRVSDFTHIIILGGAGRPDCDRCHDLCLFPLCRDYRRRTRGGWHQCGGTTVGLHSDVHRYRNTLERLQHTSPCGSIGHADVNNYRRNEHVAS